MLSPLVHGQYNEKMEFVCKLFDLSKSEKITINDLKYVLYSQISLNSQKLNYEFTPIDHENVDKNLKSLIFSQSANTPQEPYKPQDQIFSYSEFSNVLPAFFDPNKIFDIFQITPSPIQEKAIITKILQKTVMQNNDTYYVINNKWYRAWNNFANNCDSKINEIEPENIDFEKTMRIYKSPMKYYLDYKNIKKLSKYEMKQENNYENSFGKPGEIDNSELEGFLPGSLKDGLMVFLKIKNIKIA